MPVVVEVAAVPARLTGRERLAAGRDADDADHRVGRERDPVVHLHDPVPHLEHLGDGRLDEPAQLPEAGDQRRDAPLDRPHVEDLRHERVTGLGAAHRHRPRGAVDATEVDVGDEVGFALDLPREAVVRLEGDDVAGLDLEDGLEIGPKAQITWSRVSRCRAMYPSVRRLVSAQGSPSLILPRWTTTRQSAPRAGSRWSRPR